MSKNNDYSIETLRLQTPEEMGRGRMQDINEAVNNIGEVLRVPQSPEVEQYQSRQETEVVAEAENYTKQAASELFVDRALQSTFDAYTGFEQNPLFDLEDTNV